MASFHEHGNARVVKLAKGNLEVAQGATVTLVQVTATTADTAKIKVDGEVTTYVATDTSVVPMSGNNQPEAVEVANSENLDIAVAIVNGTAVDALPSSFASGTMILLVDTDTNVAITGGTIVGNFTKLKATVSGSGTIKFENIYTTSINAQGFTGTITFDGGVLDNGGRGTADEDAAIYLNAACTAVFKNMTIAASLTKGIKASNVASITIDNCEFDATNLTIAQAGNNSDLQSLSLVDIQCTTVSSNITIKNSTFKGAPKGATSVPAIVDASGNLEDSDTGAAIKIKAEKGIALGSVTITGNKFVDNYRDIVVGTGAYADKFQSTNANDRCPEMLCENNKITSWNVANNTTNLTSEVIANRAVATLSHNSGTFGGIFYNKYTTDAAKCGKLVGGVGIWVIADCYVKDAGTWYYVSGSTTYSVTANSNGSVTLTPR